MCGCKRSLADFSAPLSPFKYSGVLAHLNEIQNDNADDTAQASTRPAEKKPINEHTVGELTRAGWTTQRIAKAICSLPDIVLPAFQDDNICHCKYEGILRCMAPGLSKDIDDFTELVGEMEAPRIASPYSKDNILVNAIMRLATRFICHEDSLPFWAGMIACDLLPEGDRSRFQVHPRKHLSHAREVNTMRHLIDFANQSRVHFKLVNDEIIKDASAYTIVLDVPREDPNTTTDFIEGQSYAYRDGKAIIEKPDRQFVHILMNTNTLPGFDQSSDEWQNLTIETLKAVVFKAANTLCHEFSHAMMRHYVVRTDHSLAEARLNGEPVAEAGYCWENFAFGGMIDFDVRDGKCDMFAITPWPDLAKLTHYRKTNSPMPLHCFQILPTSRTHQLLGDEHEKFLKPSFWKQKKDPKAFKKMWLRPYYEAPMDEDEYETYSTGHEPPVDALAKKRRLSDATMDRERAYAQKLRRNEGMTRPGRWHRYMEKLQERKEDLHDREKDLLNALWKRCVPDFDGKTFLK